MSSRETKTHTEDFLTRLDEFRLSIESLPEEERAYFQSAIDEAEQQHNQMQDNCSRIRDGVADLGLIVEHAKFNLEACRRELHQLDPERDL